MEAILLQVGLMGKKRERPRCGVSKGAMHRWCELVFIFCVFLSWLATMEQIAIPVTDWEQLSQLNPYIETS